MIDRAHPREIARSRAHQRRRPGSCASDDNQTDLPCDCQPDPTDLADVWAGRARMARARRDAGQPLDDTDRALDSDDWRLLDPETVKRLWEETDGD